MLEMPIVMVLLHLQTVMIAMQILQQEERDLARTVLQHHAKKFLDNGASTGDGVLLSNSQ